MGNSNVKGGIHIVPSETSVLMGCNITGTVNLVLREPIKGNRIVFVFEGSECYKSNPGDSGYNKHKRICRKEAVLFTWTEKKVPAGQYSFVFSFLTPENLPGSFSYKTIAKLAYTIKAVLVTKQGNAILADKSEVTLLNPTRMNIEPVHQELLHRVRTFFFNRGQLCLRVHLDKNAYFIADTVFVLVEIDNSSCSKSIQSLRLALTRSLVFRTNSVTSKIIRETIYQVRVNKVFPAKLAVMGDEAVNAEIPLHMLNEKIGRSGTSSGRLIECKYWIELEAEFGGITGKKKSTFEVFIHPEGVAPRVTPEISEVWEPQVMPLSRMSYADLPEPSAPYIDEDDYSLHC